MFVSLQFTSPGKEYKSVTMKLKYPAARRDETVAEECFGMKVNLWQTAPLQLVFLAFSKVDTWAHLCQCPSVLCCSFIDLILLCSDCWPIPMDGGPRWRGNKSICWWSKCDIKTIYWFLSCSERSPLSTNQALGLPKIHMPLQKRHPLPLPDEYRSPKSKVKSL